MINCKIEENKSNQIWHFREEGKIKDMIRQETNKINVFLFTEY